jgi:hypothetical protein
VCTVEEEALFHDVYPQFTPNKVTDWGGMTMHWNQHVLQCIRNNPTGAVINLYLKTPTFLKQHADKVAQGFRVMDAFMCSQTLQNVASASNTGTVQPQVAPVLQPTVAGPSNAHAASPTSPQLAAPSPRALPGMQAMELQALEALQQLMLDGATAPQIQAFFTLSQAPDGPAPAKKPKTQQQQQQQQQTTPLGAGETFGQYKLRPAGQGKGGGARPKVCWPCTTKGRGSERTAQDADVIVGATNDHKQKFCPWCKKCWSAGKGELRYLKDRQPAGWPQHPVCTLH